ncbi:tryptophan synthase subunit beta, partial [Brevibacterium paucivorans]
GEFGGRFFPEALVPALDQIEEAWRKAMVDPGFAEELTRLQAE